ncbi:hypothetical protein [Halorubrum lipolyticum]|uniref:hypothetical protein n=1 Tax=Halorubrum lipolyticum TaxID=368624 RepID=UPI000677C3E8|nr:hypothetical protein [Halorubrum lipolyticum]
MGAATNAVQNAGRKALDERTDEPIVFCQANGIHVDELDIAVEPTGGSVDGSGCGYGHKF